MSVGIETQAGQILACSIMSKNNIIEVLNQVTLKMESPMVDENTLEVGTGADKRPQGSLKLGKGSGRTQRACAEAAGLGDEAIPRHKDIIQAGGA